MGRACGSLLLLLAIAYGARLAWDLLQPLVPTLAAVAGLIVVWRLLFRG
jgi:hypothetical protein